MRIIILTLICFLVGFGQEPHEANLESLTDGTEEEESIREMLDRLEELRRNPVNITTPAYGELLRIPFLSPLTAESIILLADTVALNDIALVRNASLMTPELFERIAPYITASSSGSISALFVPHHAELRTRLERRLQSTKGFRERKYDGDLFASYQRMELEGDHFTAAFLREKDAGETEGAGFSAAFLSVKDLAGMDRFIAGNYSVSSAQGLIFARSMTPAKGSDAVGQSMLRSSGIVQSVSADEFRYFHGAALRATILPFSLSLFLSSRTLPSSVDSSGFVTSFYTSGLFRNASELDREAGVRERTVGGIAEYRPVPTGVVSLNFLRVQYGRGIRAATITVPEDRPVYAGSVGWDLPFLGLRWFGEIASNDRMRYTTVAGIVIPVQRVFSLTYHHRSLPESFTSPFARPFSERTVGSGEYGHYVGMEFAAEGFRIAAYVDQARFPSSAEEFASSRIERSVFAELPVLKGHTLHLQYRSATAIENGRIATDRARIGYSFNVGNGISLHHRMEQVRVSDGQARSSETGVLSFSELQWQTKNRNVSFRTRVVWFDAPSYAARLYQYEPDVPGNVSNPPLYGNGFRWFALVRYQITDGCWFSAKYAELTKLHEVSLGSGDDSIDGALDARAAVQLDFRL